MANQGSKLMNEKKKKKNKIKQLPNCWQLAHSALVLYLSSVHWRDIFALKYQSQRFDKTGARGFFCLRFFLFFLCDKSH